MSEDNIIKFRRPIKAKEQDNEEDEIVNDPEETEDAFEVKPCEGHVHVYSESPETLLSIAQTIEFAVALAASAKEVMLNMKDK